VPLETTAPRKEKVPKKEKFDVKVEEVIETDLTMPKSIARLLEVVEGNNRHPNVGSQSQSREIEPQSCGDDDKVV
jgi:hypothetical protein